MLVSCLIPVRFVHRPDVPDLMCSMNFKGFRCEHSEKRELVRGLTSLIRDCSRFPLEAIDVKKLESTGFPAANKEKQRKRNGGQKGKQRVKQKISCC